jgi:hypothetical protein
MSYCTTLYCVYVSCCMSSAVCPLLYVLYCMPRAVCPLLNAPSCMSPAVCPLLYVPSCMSLALQYVIYCMSLAECHPALRPPVVNVFFLLYEVSGSYRGYLPPQWTNGPIIALGDSVQTFRFDSLFSSLL